MRLQTPPEIPSERLRPPLASHVTGTVGADVCDDCRAIQAIVDEMDALVAMQFEGPRRQSRRMAIQRRQIAMYVSHVVLCHSLTDIGLAFGRDRTTVSHACHVIEDRRDEPGFDRFIASVERVAMAVFHKGGLQHGG